MWTGETGLKPGTPDWSDTIEREIEGAGCVVALLTPAAKKSGSVGVREERKDHLAA